MRIVAKKGQLTPPVDMHWNRSKLAKFLSPPASKLAHSKGKFDKVLTRHLLEYFLQLIHSTAMRYGTAI